MSLWKLIRAMSKVFGSDKSFETSLRLILKDTSGQTLEQMHLKSVRHGGVFHFLPERFAKAIAKTPMTNSVFASTVGQKRGNIHYAFADYITAEMTVGTRLDDNVFVTQMMEKTLSLVKQFVEHSENFIADQLNGWGSRFFLRWLERLLAELNFELWIGARTKDRQSCHGS